MDAAVKWLRSRFIRRPVLKVSSKRPRPKRLRRLTLNITKRSQVVISVRRFSTRPSKRYKQLVISFPERSIREIAIVYKRRGKRKVLVSNFLNHPQLYRQALPLLLIAFSLAGTLLFALDLHSVPNFKPVNSVAALPVQVQAKPKTLPRSEPLKLRIPKIDVDTSLVTLGRSDNGTIQTPDDFDKAGWYHDAPTPGELGPAIMIGHFDKPDDVAVFWRLRELVPGDTVEVDRADGQTARFVVNQVKQFPQTDFPIQEVYGNIDYAGLRLITCGGTYNMDARRYNDNTVVYTSLQ